VEVKMNKHSLYPILALTMVALAGLACGGASSRTTTETRATSTDSTALNPNPPQQPTTTKPKSTPTPEPQIELEAENYTYYRDIIESLWFVGEITNKGDAPAGDVQIAVSLLDNNGNVVATGSDIVFLIQANGKFPFRILVDNAPQEWKEVKIQIQGSPYDNQTFFPIYTDLTIENVTGKSQAYGNYELTGIVKNTGTKIATLVHIVAAAYDEAGKVIDVGDTYATFDEIAPGGDSPFSLDFGNIDDAPAKYEIFAQSSLTK